VCKNQSIMHIGRCVLECDFWCDTDDDDDDDDEGTFECRWSV